MSEVKIFYIRDANRHPLAVVAYRINFRDDVAEFAVATRNPADDWDRERGKAIAIGRLEKSPYVAFFQKDESPRSAIRQQLLVAPQTSSRVRRAIRDELAKWRKADRRDTERAPALAGNGT